MKCYRLVHLGEILEQADLVFEGGELVPTKHPGIQHKQKEFLYLREIPDLTEVVKTQAEEIADQKRAITSLEIKKGNLETQLTLSREIRGKEKEKLDLFEQGKK